MLSCGLASAPALEVLMRRRAVSVLVDDPSLHAATDMLGKAGVRTTASGAAGLAGLMRVANEGDLRRSHGVGTTSVVLLIITEAAARDPDDA